jgi:nucleotide-binding universal stress UspA family protein
MIDAAPLNVLLATDGSTHSRAAEDLLAGLRWPAGSAATVLAALRERWTFPQLGPGCDSDVHAMLARLKRAAHDEAQATARAAARRLGQAGLATMMVVREGEPGPVLLELAAEARTNLVVLGAKGFSQFNAPRLGSTAWEAVHAAPASVLIARPGPRSRPARVVLAADGLTDWMAPHAWPVALLPPEADLTVASLATAANGEGEAADLQAVEFAEALQAQGLTVRNVFPPGEPRAELVRLALAGEADLVIVSGQAAGGQLAPAVAKYAPCSVLVARSPAPEQAVGTLARPVSLQAVAEWLAR